MSIVEVARAPTGYHGRRFQMWEIIKQLSGESM